MVTSSLRLCTRLPARSPLSNCARTGTRLPTWTLVLCLTQGRPRSEGGSWGNFGGNKESWKCWCVWGGELGCSRHEARLALKVVLVS